MTAAEPWTELHDTPNKSIRQNVPRRGAVLHHAAMTNLDELIRLEMGAKQVSSTATCKDDRLPRMMPLDAFRAWSLSDAYWDSALRSVETCNESTNGWTVSDASHWSLARMVAYLAQRDGFWPHRDGDPKTWTVLGHREVYTIHGGSYGTACPGGMDLDLVTQRAQAILKGTALAGGAIVSIPKGRKMFIAASTDGTQWLVTEDGWLGLGSMQVVDLFKRLIKSTPEKPETFNRLEVDMMNAQQRLLRTGNRVDVTVDPVKLASALRDELVKAGIPVTVENLQDADFEVDPAALAAAFDAAVPRIARALVKQTGELLAGAE